MSAHARKTVEPVDVQRMVASIAATFGDKGGVLITLGEDGIRIGVSSLTPAELREALCTAIHYSYVFERE